MIIFEECRSRGKQELFFHENINLNFEAHIHSSFEVIFVVHGCLKCILNQEEYVLKPGDALLVLPGEIHSYQTEENSLSRLCIFSTDFVEDFYSIMQGKRYCSSICHVPEINEIMDRLNHTRNLFIKKSCLYEICGIFDQRCRKQAREQQDWNLAVELALYVEKNYRNTVSLKQFAREYGYNYTYLSAFFHQSFHQNFSAYVNRYRINYAAYLLINTKIPITEIASECGFSTIRNFNYVFQKYYLQSPKMFRHSGNDSGEQQ